MLAQSYGGGIDVVPIAAIAAALLLVLGPVISYNRFVSQRNLIADSFSNIDTELRRRHDLIPNLVRTVQGYAAHEREVFDRVTRARTSAVAASGAAAQSEAERVLVAETRGLLAVAEDYPELRASESFLELQRELANTEDRIQAARRFYNANVRDLNRRIGSVPSNIIARIFGFTEARFFEVEPIVREAPQVG